MATKETRRQRGRRRGLDLAARLLAELRAHRVTSDISLRAMGGQLGCSPATVMRREAYPAGATVVQVAEMASVLGLELSVGLHPVGDPIRDKGQQALGARFDVIPGPAWRSASEVPFPMLGDLRGWDRLLRLTSAPTNQVVGVDLETRIRDIQYLTRRTRLRERDGGADEILIVLSDSATNRRLVGQLREALGPAYATPARGIMAALREGRSLPGSGVILL